MARAFIEKGKNGERERERERERELFIYVRSLLSHTSLSF